MVGKIILVGAGCGNPELLTLKAVRVLKEAEIVLYDKLVSPEVLAMANPQAEKISVGKKGHGKSCRQSDINEMMVRFALDGKIVVRLKGGDPLIFSRAAEEMAAARGAGIEVEVVSGITTAQSVAAILGFPLTHRESARRLQFVTGHDHKGGLPEGVDWQAVADENATTVVYMPKKTLSALSEKIQEFGLNPDTPAVAVMNATLPSQKIIKGTINTIPQLLEDTTMEGAVLVVIGKVVN
ncbi:MAG: uroporphyrinogen-III C-methyltransferase [Rickettsiales bacterium]